MLLKAYACGIFPMAESADDPALYWIEPDMRGVIPLGGVPCALALGPYRSLIALQSLGQPGLRRRHRRLRRAQTRSFPDLDQRTHPEIYRALYEHGHCHTVEVYDGGELVGGLYGVSLGRAFFGESMFHRARDASKIALVHLIARLKAGGYRLLDTQYVTEHLKTFGAIEVPNAAITGSGRSAARRGRLRRLAARRPVSGAEGAERIECA